MEQEFKESLHIAAAADRKLGFACVSTFFGEGDEKSRMPNTIWKM
jgi:hypothetical protein